MIQRATDSTPAGSEKPQGDFGETDSNVPLVVMRGIRKSFGHVEVLHGVDLEVEPGLVHALAGENGAGKSTLIKIISGVYGDFTGETLFDGEPRRFTSPIDAANAGIATIHQELSLVPALSVMDNLFLGREAVGRFGLLDYGSQEDAAKHVLESLELDFSPRTLVENLPISVQQLLEIGRALMRDVRLLILDEPTSALNDREAEILFNKIVEMRCQGCGIVYITHRMEEIYRLADRITVLRDGKVVGTSSSIELAPNELVKWMVGKDVVVTAGERREMSGENALEVSNLRVAHKELRGRVAVDDLSFKLRHGEILGLAGLQGSGTSEVLHALFGALGKRASGKVNLCGQPFELRGPRHSIQSGLVLLTNDRKTSGLAPDLSVVHNTSLAALARFCNKLGWINERHEAREVGKLTDELSLHAPSLDVPVNVLSGGNQQKVCLARWILTEPRVMLLDEPTRGVDVAAKADIYELMREWVDRGMSILLITSEMEELLALSDRVLVMHRGRMVAEFLRASLSKDAVLAAAMGQMEGGRVSGEEYSA